MLVNGEKSSGIVNHGCFPGTNDQPSFESKISNSKILLQFVPAIFTYLFQPLDVQEGPNGFVKRLMKKKITDWYASQITLAMEEGEELETIEVPLKLSNIKLLHVKWLMEMYNKMTSDKGRKVCLKGWEVSRIKAAVE